MKNIMAYIAVYMCVVALLTVLTVLFFRIFAPIHYPVLLAVIPIYFCLLGLLSFAVSRYFLNSTSKVHSHWILFRYCKIILSIAFLFIYAIIVHKTIVSFMLTFFVFYFVLMIVEIIFMLNLMRSKSK